MWTAQNSSRFQELRQRQAEGTLTLGEQAELAKLTDKLEATEAAYLGAAIHRLDTERRAIERQNARLEAVASRKEALVLRLRDFLAEARQERSAIENELSAALAEASSPTDK